MRDAVGKLSTDCDHYRDMVTSREKALKASNVIPCCVQNCESLRPGYLGSGTLEYIARGPLFNFISGLICSTTKQADCWGNNERFGF